MATNKNITMKQFNGTDYDTLYPKTKVEQVEGAYTQQQILANATKAMFGLGDTAVPDEVLSFLGKYAQHWWKRRTFETALILGEEENASVGAKPNSATSYTISYSSDITVDLENKTVSLSEPISTVSVSYNSKANADVLAGKYFVSNYDSQIYYATPGVTATSEYNYDSNQYYVYILAKSCVVDDILGNFEFIQSSNRNAYPDSGVQDGYEYQYLGVPFENAVNSPKVEIVEYTGTGTYGSSNPNTLTFSRVPEIVFFKDGGNGYGIRAYAWGDTQFAGLVGNSNYYLIASVEGTTMTWYVGGTNSSIATANTQMNVSGKTYQAIALCS